MSIGFVSDLGEYYYQHQQTDSVTEIISQCAVKHITLQIKAVTAILKVSTCITTSITCRANGLWY